MWCHTSCKIDKKKTLPPDGKMITHSTISSFALLYIFLSVASQKHHPRTTTTAQASCRSIKHNLHITSYKLNIFHMHYTEKFKFSFSVLRIWIFFYLNSFWIYLLLLVLGNGRLQWVNHVRALQDHQYRKETQMRALVDEIF